MDAVPRARLPHYLAAANVSVSPIPPLSLYTISSPTKVLESLGMAIPVVANLEIPDQDKIVTESGGGLCVPYEASAVARAIAQFLRDPSGARQAGRQGREYVVRERSYTKLATEIEAHYARLLSGRNASYVSSGKRV